MKESDVVVCFFVPSY